MDKRIFKISGNIAMMANLLLSIWIALIIVVVLFFLKIDIARGLLLTAFVIFYIFTIFVNIKLTKKLKALNIDNKELLEFVNPVLKMVYWFIFPLLFVLSIQRLRSKLWDFYSKQEVKGIKSEAKLLKKNLKILEELNDDQFITNYYYEKTKSRLEELLERLKNKKKK